MQLQHPLPPVRWKQNSTDNLPETIEVDETNVAEKPTHLALVLKQKKPDQGFEIGRSENTNGINNGLQYDEMYAFVDLKCFMSVSPNEYVIVPPKSASPISSTEVVDTGMGISGAVQSLSDDIDNFVAVPMPANNLTNPTFKSNLDVTSNSQSLSQLSFSPQLTVPVSQSIVSNHNGPLIYQNTTNQLSSIGNYSAVPQEYGIHLGSDITSASGPENLSSIITGVTSTDSIQSNKCYTTYYTNQAGEIITTIPSHVEGVTGEGLLPGQTYIIPTSSASTGSLTLPQGLSPSAIPDTFNISTTSLQPQFAPMQRQINTRPYHPNQGIIVPVSTNNRGGPILISTPNQSVVGMNSDYKSDIHNELIRNESFSRESLHPSQLAQLPSLIALPPRAAGCQQIDLGQIVRQTITAPISSISVEAGEHLHSNGATSVPTTGLATQQGIPMDMDVNNHQIYSIPMSRYPASCPGMSTATMEAAEAAVLATNNLNDLPSTTPTVVYSQSSPNESPVVSVAMPTVGNEITAPLSNTQTNVEEHSLTLPLGSTNSVSSTLPTISQSSQNEVNNVLNGYQGAGYMVSTSFEPSTSLAMSKSVSTTSAEKAILLQNRPMIMEVKDVVHSNTAYEQKPIYKCISGNEDTENDSGIENDCLSNVSGRVIVEEAKSIPIDDRTMTIVQIENLDVMNSQDVEVASTVIVESTENKGTTSPITYILHKGKEISNPASPTHDRIGTSANEASQDQPNEDLISSKKSEAIVKPGGKEIEFTMF